MPLDLAQSIPNVDDETIQIDVELPAYGQTIKVWFDPTRYDWRIEHMLNNARSLPANAIKDFVVTFVTDWELDFNGVRIQPTTEDIEAHNVHFLHVLTPVASAVLEKLTEGKVPKNVSPSRSPTVLPQQKKSNAVRSRVSH